ncbi:hypothetical protein KXV85_003968, partial [Aspergillus fumigatus]
DGADATFARPFHSRADHRPCPRCAACLQPVRVRGALSAGAVRLFRFLSRMAAVGHDHRHPGLLDTRLHRPWLLAADEAVLRVGRAVPVCRRHPAAGTRHARCVPGRAGRTRQRQRRMANREPVRAEDRHDGGAPCDRPCDGVFADRLSRPDRAGAAGARRAIPARAARRHDQPFLRQRPHPA